MTTASGELRVASQTGVSPGRTEPDGELLLRVSGTLEPTTAAGIEEAVWERMHFASHLRTDRLGEFTIGTELHRSESLAVIQVLILYHLITARASLALGGDGTRAPTTTRRELQTAGT